MARKGCAMRTLTNLSARLLALVLAVIFMTVSGWAASTTFSLSANWSNTSNPNGPWSYNQGSTALPLVSDWTAAGTAFVGCNQPAWAPSNNSGDFLPAEMKANSCTAKDLGTDPHNKLPNVDAGDIVVHTVDSANGNPANGVANFVLTVPEGDAGLYTISGSVWDAGLDEPDRPQDWELLINGVKKASGVLSGSVSRSEAQTIHISATLAAGDKVELELFKDAASAFGYFVGVNLSITPACVLADTPKYVSGTLTMNFSLATPVAATWDGWLVAHNSATQLWSLSEPVIEPPVAETKTDSLAASGEVGILSTLTTPTGGITCSSWTLVNTGTP